MKAIDVIAGARPNFVKIAALYAAFRQRPDWLSHWRVRLVHTGQHYDQAMSGEFFEQFNLPAPDVNLGAGSGTQAGQAGAIMVGYEQVLSAAKPDLCLVVGDVTSTMACAIVARKMGVPVAHVEGGIRSHDWTMPEEVNRVVTDAITNWFFTTSRSAGDNLLRAGIAPRQIFFVGNTMIDTLLSQLPHLSPPAVWETLGLADTPYFVVTLHRPSNVDEEEGLAGILSAIAAGASGLPVVFPVHPRTAAMLRRLGGRMPNLFYVEPLGYRQFNFLVKHACAVVTDSGGVTEEATVLGVPCITLRSSTERPETVTVGTNELIGSDPGRLGHLLRQALVGEWKAGGVPELWDGRAAERIVGHLDWILNQPQDRPARSSF